MIFDEIKSEIDKANNIAIFTHKNSDGDAIGSCIAMKLFLEGIGKKVQIFVQKPVQENYFFMGVKEHIFQSINDSFDLAISLDCPDKSRFGIYQSKFDMIKRSIAIDHHQDFSHFADINFVDTSSSSNCLIIYEFLKHIQFEITSDMALCLYSGMATDTGRFSYGLLNEKLFNAVADLFSIGFNFETANYYLFQRKTLNQAKLYQKAISLVKICGNIAYVMLEKSIFDETQTLVDDTRGIIDFINNIENVKLSFIASESENNVFMVSIRSHENYANSVAKVFGGGGHLNASGCRIYDTLENTEKKLVDACNQVLKDKR